MKVEFRYFQVPIYAQCPLNLIATVQDLTLNLLDVLLYQHLHQRLLLDVMSTCGTLELRISKVRGEGG